jgi:Glycosyl hydrolase family 26
MPVTPAGRRPGVRSRWRAPAATAMMLTMAALGAAMVAGCAGGGRQSAPRPPVVAPVPVYPPDSLAPAHGALFGAWVQPVGYSGADAEESAVAAFERTIGRKLAINNLYVPWTAPMPMAMARWDLRRGSIPMISWAAAPTGQVAVGAYDALIRAQALRLKALHGPVLLRWFAEMDLPGSRSDAISPPSFVAAWRHIHRIFSSAGVTDVRWVWCPNGSGFAQGTAQAYYPGNGDVDWIGADGYNWAPELARARWRSFEQIFSPFYRWGLSAAKPMLVAEFGTIEGAAGAKAAWFRQADRALRTQFPAIRAVVYFESDHENFGQHFDWRVTTSRSSLVAFRAFARDPYFNAHPAIKAAAHSVASRKTLSHDRTGQRRLRGRAAIG